VSEVPAVPGAPGLAERVERAFRDGGALAEALEGYEPRESQRRMAAAVAGVLDRGGTLLAEAGTGTGKTLAYLVPAILSGHRVLVSTGTKNLQEQIFFKDLPTLQLALEVPFTATLMKGRSNYLCLHRWGLYRDAVLSEVPASARLIEAGDRVLLPIIESWVTSTDTGDRAELRDLPEDVALWKEIAADAETCLGTDCPHYSDCFITRMRQRAAESDVVIVNHHLLCADASVRQSAYGEVIPSCPTLVVDEAHQLEDVATQYFGRALTRHRVDSFLRDVLRAANAITSAPGAPHAITRSHGLDRAVERVTDRARIFFGALEDARLRGPALDARLRYAAEGMADHFDDGVMLAGALEGLEASLALAQMPSPEPGGTGVEPEPDLRDALASLQRRAGEIRDDLLFLVRASDPDFVYFLETKGRGVALKASPIDVAAIVQDSIFDRMRASVLTSATLAVEGSFAYVRTRLGIRQADEIRVASEFDFATQALLYLPRTMPSPKSPAFAEAAAREVIALLRRSRGRAFVLFTSYAVLRTVQRFVEAALPYPILVQGSAPRSALLDTFRRTPQAVLLATSSFWQGVDVAGEALSCVIIDKLPFASPGDPVTAARIESIRARGGEAFGDYQVPLAILSLQQGLGRLIRHRSDRGVLAVLDPRLKTMGYGRRFLASLPDAPVTTDLDAVERFFM
jgi:ATP-dependent DNA helicase DinG